MTLTEQVKQALMAMATFSASNCPGGEQTLSAEHDGQQVRCDLTALDTLACAFSRLALQTDRLAGLSADELKGVAERLSARLTYLLEPISPIEIDSLGCTVQLRSNPPHKEENRTSYYELLISRAGEISLRRYCRQPGAPRTIIAAEVTRAVLLRLVGDFAAAAG